MSEDKREDKQEQPAEAEAEAEAKSATPAKVKERGNRKTLVGVVVSDRMSKTRMVAVQRQEMHRRYKKFVKRDTKYAAHDEDNATKNGDKVVIQETRPMSKRKRWRIVKKLA